jgi:hypothetical protein
MMMLTTNVNANFNAATQMMGDDTDNNDAATEVDDDKNVKVTQQPTRKVAQEAMAQRGSAGSGSGCG